MTEPSRLINSVAPLRNVAALVSLIERVKTRGPGLPGMATYYGYSGYGKTTAATYAANEFQAVHVQVKESWRPRKLCTAILGELGILPAGNIPDMIDQIAQDLMVTDRILLIDDAQYLIKYGMIGHVRDIFESSGAPVILIGEERLPQDLQRWENVHGRMLDWVAAEPATISDVDHLAKIYCSGVRLDPIFKQDLLQASQHSIRRVCVNLSNVRSFAQLKGFNEIDADKWGKNKFFACAAPSPRRNLA